MKPREVGAGELYRISEDLLLAANISLSNGALHLVHRVEGQLVHTLCEGACYTWHVHDFLCHARVIEDAHETG